MAACPNCSKTIEPTVLACSHCGASFEGTSAWKPLTSTTGDKNKDVPHSVTGIGVLLLAPLGALSQIVAIAFAALVCRGGCASPMPWLFLFATCVIGWLAVARSASAMPNQTGATYALAILLWLPSLIVTGLVTLFVTVTALAVTYRALVNAV